MSSIRKAIPSPALTISIVALVAALGGPAVADLASKSLDKKQTKRIARGQANKAISKRAPGLKVNSAETADRATIATNVSGRTPFSFKLSFGETRPIATNGPVSVEANCESSGGERIVRILAQTTQDGAVLDGQDSYAFANFNTGTAANDRELHSLAYPGAGPYVDTGQDDGFVMSPDGKWLGLVEEQTAVGVGYGGADCIVAGVAEAAG